jgi:hypothetical protein
MEWGLEMGWFRDSGKKAPAAENIWKAAKSAAPDASPPPAPPAPAHGGQSSSRLGLSGGGSPLGTRGGWGAGVPAAGVLGGAMGRAERDAEKGASIHGDLGVWPIEMRADGTANKDGARGTVGKMSFDTNDAKDTKRTGAAASVVNKVRSWRP